ncbi:MAG: hypothetical protein ACX931_04550 [Saccharospirillum sp.]
MSVTIEQLNLALPAGLKGRTGAITRLLYSELKGLAWPNGDWPALQPADVAMAHNATNLTIARAIARQLHRSAWQKAEGHGAVRPGSASAREDNA